jgi:hypothetical protein
MTTTRTKEATRPTKQSPRAYPAEKARRGEIILQSKWSRVVFFTGLFGGLVLLAVLAVLFGIVG